MKIFNFLKRKKKVLHKKPLQDTKKDGIEKDFNKPSKDDEIKDEVIINGDFISIPKINFRVFNPIYSENNEYMIYSSDGHVEVINNKDKFVDGLLVACKGTKLLFHKRISRPHDSKVSNNGIFITNDWLNSSDLCGTFLVFNGQGNLLFSKKVNANLYNNGLSQNGIYACFQTCNADNEDGSKLFIVDINNKVIASCFRPVGDWANSSYEFDEDNKIIKLYCQNDNSYYRYKIDGTFLDHDKLEQIALNKALNNEYGNDLKNIAFDKLSLLQNNKDLNLEDYSDFIDLITKALNKDMSDYNKAVCYRTLGEIYEELNFLVEALDNFDKAVEHYPKIGVKRKIINISKIVNGSQE